MNNKQSEYLNIQFRLFILLNLKINRCITLLAKSSRFVYLKIAKYKQKIENS